MSDDLVEQVIYYHERTKHHPYRFANNPGYLDWDNQPNPFRRFSGAPLVRLPEILNDESPPYHEIFNPAAVSPAPLTAYSLSRFLELSLAVSAWKQAGDSVWALRCNPSSGNLHPTEGYLVVPAGIHSQPAVYHYAPKIHGLERRTEFPTAVWNELTPEFPQDTFLAGLTSIYWREAWKYGERAFRYCQHDVGHALAAYRIAAAVLGWSLVLLEDVDDHSLARLLGVNRETDFHNAETEQPELICAVYPNHPSPPPKLGLTAIAKIADGVWTGDANRLSEEEVPWSIVYQAGETTTKQERETGYNAPEKPGDHILRPLLESQYTARQIIRQRRSATAFDGEKRITLGKFYTILLYTLAGKEGLPVPWDALPWSPRIHLCLYVHRVLGLEPGLYFLSRDRDKTDRLRNAMKQEFLWRKPEDCPDKLDLYLLQEGDFRGTAAGVSCSQDIAGRSAFSLGMIAEFAPSLREYGASFYRRLFWESGMIGQMLYLAAENAGIRGTGIGCYFDDSAHALLGLSGHDFQSLYHFTIGYPVEDVRLTTLPAYPWSVAAG